MTFTQLLAQIIATYREQPRRFHVLATRYYRGRETRATLAAYLNREQVDEIVNNNPSLCSRARDVTAVLTTVTRNTNKGNHDDHFR